MRSVWLVSTAIPVFGLAVASSMKLPTKLIYNGSESAPIGFYWIDRRPIVRGDYVLAEAPEPTRRLIEKRGYLPSNVPLIKQVIAVKGDEICRKERRILVDGISIAVARMNDVQGRPLPNWQGCRTLTDRQVFLMRHHPDSFDSRYFGPVDQGLIIGRAKKLRLFSGKGDPD